MNTAPPLSPLSIDAMHQPRSSFRLLPFFLFVFLLLAGCQTVPPQGELEPWGAVEGNMQVAPWSRLPPALWQDEGLAYWAAALEGSASYYAKRKPGDILTFGNSKVTAEEMVKACRDLAAMARQGDGERLAHHLKANYRLYRSIGRDNNGSVLVTAYYEPLLYGALKPDKRFRYPVYRKPGDVTETGSGGGKSGGRFYSRQEIDHGHRLAKRGLELFWVDDRIALFFLHIQGSGRVQLPDGQIIRIGYHAANGHAYRSIGKILIDEGHMTAEQVTLQSIRQWLLDHPKEQDRVLNSNPSYVFFRELNSNAVGNISVELTPGRSIATDHKLFPRGAPAILLTEHPRFAEDGHTILSWKPVARLVVNQDTGGAITGPGRVDLFLGFGEDAERTAGVMKQPKGGLFFIIPRSG